MSGALPCPSTSSISIFVRDLVMHPYISCLFTLSVKPEEFAEFKALIAKIVPETQKEPGTLIYEYSVNEDNSTAHILERYMSTPT
ncbi:Uncharacterized protein ALO94_04492, partial [Pseudomonas syringae pv. spinaceae]